MRGLIRRIFIFTILFLAVADVRAECAVPGDPFTPNGKMPRGPFAGNCLDISLKRSYRMITHEEAAKVVPADVLANSPPDKFQFVANVGHNNEFWVARFPKQGGVESISLLIERFPPRLLAAHSMMRINFKPGYEPLLYSQTEIGKRVESLAGFVISIESVKVQNAPTKCRMASLRDCLGLSKRLMSLDQKVQQVILGEQNTVRQYKLNFTDTQLDEFFGHTLESLHDPEMQQMYDLLSHNCMNGLFQVIDGYLGRARTWVNKWATFLPNIAAGALRHRGILDEKVHLTKLNDEIKTLNAHRYCPSLFKKIGETLISIVE